MLKLISKMKWRSDRLERRTSMLSREETDKIEKCLQELEDLQKQFNERTELWREMFMLWSIGKYQEAIELMNEKL